MSSNVKGNKLLSRTGIHGSLPRPKPKLGVSRRLEWPAVESLSHQASERQGRASTRSKRHVFRFAHTAAVTCIYMSLLPTTPVTSFTAPSLIQDCQRSKSQHGAALNTSTYTIRALADRLSPLGLLANCTLQLSASKTNGWAVSPPNRRYRPKAHSTRRRTATFPRPAMGRATMGRRT